jgi:hypothetical protein
MTARFRSLPTARVPAADAAIQARVIAFHRSTTPPETVHRAAARGEPR